MISGDIDGTGNRSSKTISSMPSDSDGDTTLVLLAAEDAGDWMITSILCLEHGAGIMIMSSCQQPITHTRRS